MELRKSRARVSSPHEHDTAHRTPPLSSRRPTPPPPHHPTLTPPPRASAHRLLALPPELHLHITTYLNYPDALSLKHSHPYFYALVDTGVRLKVEWLIERHRLQLDFPNEGQCVLRTDAAFCNGQVSRLMARRRRHEECVESRCFVGGLEGCRRRRRVLAGSGTGLRALRRWVGFERRDKAWWRWPTSGNGVLWGSWHLLVVVWAVIIWVVGREEGWW